MCRVLIIHLEEASLNACNNDSKVDNLEQVKKRITCHSISQAFNGLLLNGSRKLASILCDWTYARVITLSSV